MEPSRFEKMKMGAIMGGTVGLCVGLVFGTLNIVRFGTGSRGAISTLGQYMAGSAASFAFFMGIGTAIRTEEAAAITYPQHTIAPRIITLGSMSKQREDVGATYHFERVEKVRGLKDVAGF